MDTVLRYWSCGGPLMWPLAGLSLAMWFWMVSLYRQLRREGDAPADVERLLGCLAGLTCDLDRARLWISRSDAAIARIMAYVTGGDMTPEAVRARAAEATAAEISPFKRELVVLKAMVAAAPLLGLLGTVMGMIATFSALAARGTASSEALSEGISQALITTQVGLVVALPGIFGASLIGRKVEALSLAVERAVAHLVTSAERNRAALEGDLK